MKDSMILLFHLLAVMDQFTRRIIGFGIRQGDVDGPALCRMFNVAISKQNFPSYLSSDNVPLFLYHRWQANLRILEIDEVKSVPYTPISHPFVERLIASIRREFLDQTFFWTATDLERKFLGYQQYFNHHRTHSGLDGAIPVCTEAMAINLNDYRWQRHCRGLFELPVAA